MLTTAWLTPTPVPDTTWDLARRSPTTNEQLHLFGTLGRLILDPTISDSTLRTAIYQTIPPDVLQHAIEENAKVVRPLDDSYFDFLATRYSYVRQFAPAFLAAFAFQSNVPRDPLLAAITVLRDLNATQRRAIPAGASLRFVPDKWQPYVLGQDGHIDRHYYELCVLWELRNALRAGNVWLESSRRYANPETYLIPTNRWPALRQSLSTAAAARRQYDTPHGTRARAFDALGPGRPVACAAGQGPHGRGKVGRLSPGGRGATRERGRPRTTDR